MRPCTKLADSAHDLRGFDGVTKVIMKLAFEYGFRESGKKCISPEWIGRGRPLPLFELLA
jgi:hypothetical protein